MEPQSLGAGEPRIFFDARFINSRLSGSPILRLTKNHRLMRLTLGILLLVVLGTTAACSTNPPPETMTSTPPETPEAAPVRGHVSGMGTITFFDLEGGFYGLVADDGAKYDPMTLDEAFQQDGLRVRFRARLRTGVMTIRQWGKPVEILEMARLDGE